jgi:hypothetical protein
MSGSWLLALPASGALDRRFPRPTRGEIEAHTRRSDRPGGGEPGTAAARGAGEPNDEVAGAAVRRKAVIAKGNRVFRPRSENFERGNGVGPMARSPSRGSPSRVSRAVCP